MSKPLSEGEEDTFLKSGHFQWNEEGKALSWSQGGGMGRGPARQGFQSEGPPWSKRAVCVAGLWGGPCLSREQIDSGK